MLGSLYSAVSGLAAHQTKMSVVGNNIANINTYGFKSSRVTFTDVFYQTLSTASESSSTEGGTNPTQLGYGSQVNSIDVINTRAGSTTTDRALDVYINGDGLLAVQGGDGEIKYTRVGILDFDSSGNLVDSNGNILLGLPTNATTGRVALSSDGTVSTSDLSAVGVDPDLYATYTNIAIGEDGAITATAAGDPELTLTSGTGWVTGSTLPTTTSYVGDLDLTVKQASTTAPVTATGLPTGVTIGGTTTAVDMLGSATITYNSTANRYILNYSDSDGTSKTITASAAVTPVAGVYTMSFDVPTLATPPGTSAITFAVDSASATVPTTSAVASGLNVGTFSANSKTISMSTYDQGGNAVTATATWTAGSTAINLGDLTLNVDSEDLAALSDFTDKQIGTIGAGDGENVTLGYLALVKFANPSGLTQDGEGYYLETSNSGEAVATSAGNQGTGTLVSGSLESSNVDLSQELTEMIITQRGFQANSKMITVSDEMLDTLVNMKR